MPRRTDIKKVMVIGSGPIVIGQAAEFDYAGTQACLALKEEGYEVILVNSNPATIMTDTNIADKVYMEPLTLEYVAKIVRYERPDAIVPGLGGQTGLNLAVQLAKKGILDECHVEILGTSFKSIEEAEDRELFKDLCIRIGEPVLPSVVVNSMEDGVKAAEEIGYPVVLRPAFTLGGTGGGFADNEEELREIMRNALVLSPVHQVLVEKSIKGYKEIEFEVMRDKNDTAIAICSMENIDPVGIHTGDSMVIAPAQTLTDKEYQLLRGSALKIIRELKIEGGCNVQFALDPLSFKYYIIEAVVASLQLTTLIAQPQVHADTLGNGTTEEFGLGSLQLGACQILHVHICAIGDKLKDCREVVACREGIFGLHTRHGDCLLVVSGLCAATPRRSLIEWTQHIARMVPHLHHGRHGHIIEYADSERLSRWARKQRTEEDCFKFVTCIVLWVYNNV